uniref:Uncharacterized protein n=1 Tax=Candidatus Kentrum sp. TC TaxID=2126339 RepID=A0A450Z3T4_9GAMM|nr:MAG: hypothetical protein BECKTC1821D_GA0114238_105915 [Candidatus Kentron sp. TC]
MSFRFRYAIGDSFLWLFYPPQQVIDMHVAIPSLYWSRIIDCMNANASYLYLMFRYR